jgi:hypothetical protein
MNKLFMDRELQGPRVRQLSSISRRQGVVAEGHPRQ